MTLTGEDVLAIAREQAEQWAASTELAGEPHTRRLTPAQAKSVEDLLHRIQGSLTAGVLGELVARVEAAERTRAERVARNEALDDDADPGAEEEALWAVVSAGVRAYYEQHERAALRREWRRWTDSERRGLERDVRALEGLAAGELTDPRDAERAAHARGMLAWLSGLRRRGLPRGHPIEPECRIREALFGERLSDRECIELADRLCHELLDVGLPAGDQRDHARRMSRRQRARRRG